MGVIVIDNGTGAIKAGFGGEDEPKVMFQSILGRHTRGAVGTDQETYECLGDDARSLAGLLSHLSYPIERGVVTKWDDMESIWHHAFSMLHAYPDEHQVLLTEPPMNPMTNRKIMAEIMFEKFNTLAIFVATTAIVSAIRYACTSGIIVDVGEGISYVVPLFNKVKVLEHAAFRRDLAGVDITNHLISLLNRRGYCFTSPVDHEIARDIKEKLGYVVPTSAQPQDESETSYVLPDGQVISIGSERYRCAEVLFQPSLIGMEAPGIQESLYNSIMMCHKSIRDGLLENVLLVGGSTLFPGTAERLAKEISAKSSGAMKIKIHALPERKNVPWIGGSILASLTSFPKICTTKEEFEEDGERIWHGEEYISSHYLRSG